MGWWTDWRTRRREYLEKRLESEVNFPTARAANRLLGATTTFGLVCVVLFALQASSLAEGLSVAGVALLIGASSAAAGGLLGFLFAVPRAGTATGPAPAAVKSAKTAAEAAKTAQSATDATAASVAAAQASASAAATVAAQEVKPGSGVNSNLSDVSDWLTKILVGVGLTQIGNVGPAFARLSNSLAASLGDLGASSTVAGATIILFLIVGFLAAYLETRLVLQRGLMDTGELRSAQGANGSTDRPPLFFVSPL